MATQAPTTNKHKKVLVWAAGIIAVIALLGAVAWRFGELWFRTGLVNLLKATTPFWLLFGWPILIPLALAAAGMGYALSGKVWDRTTQKYVSPNRRFMLPSIILGSFALVNLVTPAVGLFGSQTWRNGHESRRLILPVVSVSDQAHPEYQTRPNSVQANRIMNELLSDISISSTTPAQYSLSNGSPAWCVGGMGRSDFWGRKYTTRVVCIDTEGTLTRAVFTGRVPAIDGNFSTNLSKVIAETRPGTSVDEEDVRFMIKDGAPFMVVSGTSRSGGMHPITVPAGVFVFDSTGKVTYDANATAGEYGIAVLPYKVARSVRNSLNSRAGYYCERNPNKEKCLKLNTPYETTNMVNGEDAAGDVNSENFSEFVLYRADGSIGMVTPLTNYGKGRNITAYLDVDADSVTAGELPKAVLYEKVNEVSHRVVVQTLTPAYTSDLTWLSEINADADQATTSRIFEITPTKPGKMMLTIGTATNPQYIVEIDATLNEDSTEFSWCIFTDASKGQTRRLIECRKASEGEAPIGTLRGLNVKTPPTSTEPSTTITVATDLAKLSDDELLKLIEEAAAELARR